MASTELSRASGVYSSSFATRSIASGAVRGRKTCGARRTLSKWLCNSCKRKNAETYLLEGVRLDLRELVLHVVRVHRLDLLPRRGAEHLDNLDELVDATLAWEQRLAEHELRHDTSS